MMNMLHDYIGLMGCLLALVAAPLIYIRHPRFSRRVVAAVIASMVIITVMPIDGLIVAAYLRALISDLSITSMILLIMAIYIAYIGDAGSRDNDHSQLYSLVLASAVIIYPSGLGLGPWDGYATGYGSTWLYIALLAIAFWLYLKQRFFLLGVILFSIIAYLFSLLASANLWDYLIDPWITGYALIHTTHRFYINRRRNPVAANST